MKNNSIYAVYGKRFMDLIGSGILLIFLSPIFLGLSITIRKQLGKPIIFCQYRPGKDEKLFRIYKFRTMTNQKDKTGAYLSDKKRLTNFGRHLRETSLDELPELFNILKGDMSFVGPRPQLVKDMVFMTKKQRRRHKIKPGLTGLAQISGRNEITWEEKLSYDLDYLQHLSFRNDCLILLKTIGKVWNKENITQNGMDTAEDLGDYLLRTKKITEDIYKKKIQIAEKRLKLEEKR